MSAGKFTFALISIIVLCTIAGLISSSYNSAQSATANPVMGAIGSTRTPRPSATIVLATVAPSQVPTATLDRYADLHTTETAIGLWQIQIAQEQQELQLQLLRDSATSTAAAQRTNVAEVAAVRTSVVNTQIASTQQGIKTQVAGTQTAIPVTQTALAATQQVEQTRLMMSKVQTVLWPSLLAIVVLAFAILGWLWLRKKIAAKYLQESQLRPDEKGRFAALPEDAIPGRSKRVVNPNLSTRAVTDLDHDDLTSEQSMANAHDQRNLEATRAIADSPAWMRRTVGKPPVTAVTGSLPPANIGISRPMSPDQPLLTDRALLRELPLPAWSQLHRWDGKLLPYGMGRSSNLLLADPREEPHWLIVGRTRTYKSRGGLRTLSAAALTMGYQVLFIGKRVDFFPFEHHPNARIVSVDLLNEPERYLETLKKVANLMKQRDDYLTDKRLSIWQQTGRPQLYVVLDEFSAAVKQLNSVRSGAGNLVSAMATALIQEGGKYGINIIQVVQDATGSNVDISARRNMGKMVFRLSEQRASEVALGVREPSAVGLPNRYFLSAIGENAGIILGVSFAPSDEEVESFLRERPVQELEPIDWIKGEATDIGTGTSSPTDLSVDPEEQQIREILLRMAAEDKVSMRQVEREVWGKVRGGQYYEKVLRVWKEIKGATATPPGMPESGAIAAL